MIHLLEVIVITDAVVLIAFMILLALPQCKLRDILLAIGSGISTAVKTIRASKERISARNDPYFNN
jgi:hypothetical protein